MMRPEIEHEAMKQLAYDLHQEAREWTARRGYVVGSVMRGCANRILFVLGETSLPYEGPGTPEEPEEESA